MRGRGAEGGQANMQGGGGDILITQNDQPTGKLQGQTGNAGQMPK